MGKQQDVSKVITYFETLCDQKKYQKQVTEEDHCYRIDISNLTERTVVNIYKTGKIVIGGKDNLLKREFESIKKEIDSNPQICSQADQPKPCNHRYDILIPELRGRVRESLNTIFSAIELKKEQSPSIEYQLKIDQSPLTISLTQYSNGTLLLQGKEDRLFDAVCDLIEKIAKPNEKEVAARFISNNEKGLEHFSARYTPKMLEIAERATKEKLKIVFDYLEQQDRNWFVAAVCLCMTEVPLPEYSPLVMPASKAFEGFVKKLLVSIGLVDSQHFNSKSANFSPLNDMNNPNRKIICQKEKYADTFLKDINVSLDMYRNFLMHSDDSQVTKVENLETAKTILDEIFSKTVKFYDFFKKTNYF